MDLYIQSQIGECTEFLPGLMEKKQKVSIVVSPLKLQGTEGNIKVINGCNMWQGCCNAMCHYSKVARKAPKIEPK